MARRVARDFRQDVQRGADRQRHVDQIRVVNGRRELSREKFIRGAEFLCPRSGVRAVPNRDVHAFREFAQRQRKRTADEAGTENADAIDEMS